MKPKITVVGSANTDMIIRLERIPQPGETVLGGEFTTAAGGKGANQAVAAARVGGAVTLIARVGEDSFGAQAIAGFKSENIDVSAVYEDPDSASGVALIFVGGKGENSIAVASGANAKLSPADVEHAGRRIRHADLLVMQLETPLPTIECAAEIASDAGVPIILNPAPATALPPKLLERIAILTPNESEAELLTGVKVSDEDSAGQAASLLRDQGIGTVIITLGAAGAFVSGKGIHELVPAFPVTAVDSVAAGDVFNGALAVALGEDKPLLDAVRFANAAAALSTTKKGAQPSVPTREEVAMFLKRASA